MTSPTFKVICVFFIITSFLISPLQFVQIYSALIWVFHRNISNQSALVKLSINLLKVLMMKGNPFFLNIGIQMLWEKPLS